MYYIEINIVFTMNNFSTGDCETIRQNNNWLYREWYSKLKDAIEWVGFFLFFLFSVYKNAITITSLPHFHTKILEDKLLFVVIGG